MKKLVTLMIGLLLLCVTGFAQASLVAIGTANYNGTDYNLIYDDDDDDTGYGGGGLVWLDYTNSGNHTYGWYDQIKWVSGLGENLIIDLLPEYTTDINWKTGWRLPDTVDGPFVDGYEGDPDGDGNYNYTSGYNLANSEMGHLFYEELGNIGHQNTDGIYNTIPLPPDSFLQNTGDFDNLETSWYWSSTTYQQDNAAWHFTTSDGYQGVSDLNGNHGGIAIHSGTVVFNGGNPGPVPAPPTILLLSTGLIGLFTVRKRKR